MGVKQLIIFLLTCLLSCPSNRGGGGGAAGCSLENIVISQAGTGGWAHGQPEYAVTVSNTCGCSQTDVQVACRGFTSTLAVDPSKFRPLSDADGGGGGLCLVNGGGPVVQGTDVVFRYAWSSHFKLSPVSSTVRC